MSLQDEVRDDLEEEVFTEFGKTVTLKTKGSPVYNTRGELESSTESSTDIIAVPYNIIETRESNQPFGELQEGDLDMAVKYDQSIETGDIVTIESIDYRVDQVDKNFLPDNVVTIVRLMRTQTETSDD